MAPRVPDWPIAVGATNSPAILCATLQIVNRPYGQPKRSATFPKTEYKKGTKSNTGLISDSP